MNVQTLYCDVSHLVTMSCLFVLLPHNVRPLLEYNSCMAGATENAGRENGGPAKSRGVKMQDVKMTDQIAGHEIAGH